MKDTFTFSGYWYNEGNTMKVFVLADYYKYVGRDCYECYNAEMCGWGYHGAPECGYSHEEEIRIYDIPSDNAEALGLEFEVRKEFSHAEWSKVKALPYRLYCSGKYGWLF